MISVLRIFLVGQLFMIRHHRHGGGAAEQVAQSQVEEEGCAVHYGNIFEDNSPVKYTGE